MINEIVQGDSLEILKTIPDKSIDLVLTDPPYGTTACKWDEIVPFQPMWSELERILKNDGVVVMSASQPFTSKLVVSNISNFKYEWVWNKKQTGNPFLAKKQPLKVHESVLVFYGGKYFPQMRTGVMRKKGGAKKSLLFNSHTSASKNDQYYPVSILEFVNGRINKLHPTQKPVELFKYLVETYSKRGDTILDPFAGSGTTCLAAKELNRNFIGIEREAEYVEIAKARLAAVQPTLNLAASQ